MNESVKKYPLIFILLLALSALGAKNFRTVRVTIVNKSGMPVEVSMTGRVQEMTYYVRLPEGDRTSPTEAVVDVVPDDYSFKIYYVELWDPVYGTECGEGSNAATVTHRMRLNVLECTNKTPNNGEPPTILKYPAGRSGRGGFKGR